jgi:hypothetical protein
MFKNFLNQIDHEGDVKKKKKKKKKKKVAIEKN